MSDEFCEGTIMAVISLEGNAVCSSNVPTSPLSIHNYFNDEQSEMDGQPVELYLFDKDGSEFWSYSSSDSDFTFNGRIYLASLIKRGDIVLDASIIKTVLRLEVDTSNSFARQFISESLDGIIKLTIYRWHRDSYVTYWKGYVRGISFRPRKAIIIAGLKVSSLKREGLMRKYSRNCGLHLYSALCGISKTDTDYYVEGTINSVNGTEIDATIFSSKSDGWFVGGQFKTDNGKCNQKIVYHVGTKIKIARYVSGIANGNTFLARAGCDHLKATCKDKFSNKLNFGGQPYLPDKNPFTGDAVN